jgi:hypothetical protein
VQRALSAKDGELGGIFEEKVNCVSASEPSDVIWENRVHSLEEIR